jgi:hypothetical protein
VSEGVLFASLARTYENVGPVQSVHESTEPSLKLPGGQASMPVRSDPAIFTLLPVGTGEQ